MLGNASTALLDLGRALRTAGYRFITVTPETHRQNLARRPGLSRDLRDVFGWSRPFDRKLLPAQMLELLEAAGALVVEGDALRSQVRFSTLNAHLLVHSAFPTRDTDSVFFGPDTYRFCRHIQSSAIRARRVVDIGCGSGAGGIVAGSFTEQVTLTDVNERALQYAEINAHMAGMVGVEIVESDVMANVSGDVDLVIANPPYMTDELGPIYRDGGGSYGEQLAARIVQESLERLTPGGTLLLYTGAAMVDGEDTFWRAVASQVARFADRFTYEELDPDVFGEELQRPAYANVERIAAVALKVIRR